MFDDPSADTTVLYEVQDQVALVTLNRPERLNAWTSGMLERYFDRLAQAARDPEVRVIVVTGAGRGFCAGVDMDSLDHLSSAAGETPEPRAGPRQADRRRSQMFPLTVAKPIVAAINGACAGLGLVQALMCDVRFAASGAKLTTSFARRGLIAEHGISWILPRLGGVGVALDLLMSGRVVMAEEAAALGLVSRVMPRDELLSYSIDYARDIAANCSPRSLASIKRQVYRHLATDPVAALHESNWMMTNGASRRDFKEGVRSFIEHRPPSFEPLPAELAIFEMDGPLGRSL